MSAATKELFFIFDNSLYHQVDGVAIGYPLGTTLTNSFLCYYGKEWLNSCPIEFTPKVFKRCIDDILVMFQSRDRVMKVNLMNTKHPSKNLTLEVEVRTVFHFWT